MPNKRFQDVSILPKKKQHFWQSKLLKKGLLIWKGKNSTIETKTNRNQSSRNPKMTICWICSSSNKKSNRKNLNKRKRMQEVFIRNRLVLLYSRKIFLKLIWTRKKTKKRKWKRRKKTKISKKNLLKLRKWIRNKKLRKKRNRKRILIKSLKNWDVILFYQSDR